MAHGSIPYTACTLAGLKSVLATMSAPRTRLSFLLPQLALLVNGECTGSTLLNPLGSDRSYSTVWNDDPIDDTTLPDGTIVLPGEGKDKLSDREYYEFGESCELL